MSRQGGSGTRKTVVPESLLRRQSSVAAPVTANVVLLPRIKRTPVSRCIPVIPTATPVITNNVSGPLEEKQQTQPHDGRLTQSRHHATHPSTGQAVCVHPLRKRTASKQSAIIVENEEWFRGNYAIPVHPCVCSVNNNIHRVELRRQDSACSGCGGSITTPSLSMGSTRRCSAVEVELSDDRHFKRNPLLQMQDAYDTFETNENELEDLDTGVKLRPTAREEVAGELRQLRRERNLLRDLLAIIYSRNLIAEDVRPYCKRALELCGRKLEEPEPQVFHYT